MGRSKGTRERERERKMMEMKLNAEEEGRQEKIKRRKGR